MTLRKTNRFTKRRRAHSKKTRKMRGGYYPKKDDRIMYFRFYDDTEGYSGTITEVGKEGVLVGWDGYSHPRFKWDHWKRFVQNHYGSGNSVKLVNEESAKKTEGTAEIFPQIAFLKPQAKSKTKSKTKTKSALIRFFTKSKKSSPKSTSA